jgi:hypothetical protein
VINVCGNARFGNDQTSGADNNPCSAAIAYTGATNVEIVVHQGTFDMFGCSMSNSGAGGVTFMFAPINPATKTTVGGTQCTGGSSGCFFTSDNGTIDIAAPTSGTFSGMAVMQNDELSPTNKATGKFSTNWAGNKPTLKAQGIIYVPNNDWELSGAIDFHTGGLNCLGVISNSFLLNGTSAFIGFTSLTGDCVAAGVNNLPKTPGTFQSLIG